jgi:glycosyltransferase involved in cell wall biosynthesis
MMNKISVVTVCFNESEEKIKHTFHSIISQNYTSVEFIVVDGGSNEYTLNALRLWSSKINHFVSEPDKGIFDAMNKGIRLATGDWICFMNVGDSFYNNEALSKLIQSNDKNVDILYGDVYKLEFGLIISPDKLNSYTFYDLGICHQAILSHKRVFEKIGDFDLSMKLYGDADWVMRAFISGFSFLHIPEIVCVYQGGGVTSDNTILQEDRRNYLQRYFNIRQRSFYKILSIYQRILNRIISFNMSIPYFLKKPLIKLI